MTGWTYFRWCGVAGRDSLLFQWFVRIPPNVAKVADNLVPDGSDGGRGILHVGYVTHGGAHIQGSSGRQATSRPYRIVLRIFDMALSFSNSDFPAGSPLVFPEKRQC